MAPITGLTAQLLITLGESLFYWDDDPTDQIDENQRGNPRDEAQKNSGEANESRIDLKKFCNPSTDPRDFPILLRAIEFPHTTMITEIVSYRKI